MAHKLFDLRIQLIKEHLYISQTKNYICMGVRIQVLACIAVQRTPIWFGALNRAVGGYLASL